MAAHTTSAAELCHSPFSEQTRRVAEPSRLRQGFGGQAGVVLTPDS